VGGIQLAVFDRLNRGTRFFSPISALLLGRWSRPTPLVSPWTREKFLAPIAH